MGEIREMIANRVVNLEMLIDVPSGIAEAENPQFGFSGWGEMPTKSLRPDTYCLPHSRHPSSIPPCGRLCSKRISRAQREGITIRATQIINHIEIDTKREAPATVRNGTGLGASTLVRRRLSEREVSAMFYPLDIFKTDPDGSVLWLGAVESVVAAKLRIQRLARSSPGEYLILDK